MGRDALDCVPQDKPFRGSVLLYSGETSLSDCSSLGGVLVNNLLVAG